MSMEVVAKCGLDGVMVDNSLANMSRSFADSDAMKRIEKSNQNWCWIACVLVYLLDWLSNAC